MVVTVVIRMPLLGGAKAWREDITLLVVWPLLTTELLSVLLTTCSPRHCGRIIFD